MDNKTSPTNGFKKSMGVLFAALLVFGAVAGVLAYLPKANAQAVLITTSSNTFFGNGFVQVIINDPAKNSQSTAQETTAVTVRVKDDTGATRTTSTTLAAREIGENSGQFEFFITTSNNDPAAARSILADTTPTAADVAVFRANNPAPTGNTHDDVKDSGAKPANNWKFEIEYAGQIKVVNFASTSATFNLDRTTAGSANIVRLIINDQDANIDPTTADRIQGVATATTLFADVDNSRTVNTGDIALVTGSFTPGVADIDETGPNTNVFEFSITQGTVTTTSVVTYRFTDFDVYTPFIGTADTAVTSRNIFAAAATSSTTDRTLTLKNSDGTLTPVSSVTFGSEIPITVTDSDRNLDSRVANTVNGGSGSVAVGYTTTGATVTTTGASTGTVTMVQTLTFGSDPGTIRVTTGAVTGTGTGGGFAISGITAAVTAPAPTTRTVTLTISFTTTGAATDVAVGTIPVITSSAVAMTGNPASGGAPVIAGSGGAMAGAGNVQTIVSTGLTGLGQTPSGVIAYVDSDNGDVAAITVKEADTEAGRNSGVFAADLNNGQLQVSFVTGQSGVVGANAVLEMRPADVSGNVDIVIQYIDPAKEDGTAGLTSTIRTTVSHTAGILSFDVAKAGPTDKVNLRLNDNDLNNNPGAKEAYTFTLPATGGANTVPIAGGGTGADIAEFEFRIKGSLTDDSETTQTVTLIETDINSGVFTGTLDISKIDSAAGGVTLNDGDRIELIYKDKHESPVAESTASLTIGKPSTGITVDKTSVPLPLSAAQTGGSADSIKVRLTVTDPSRNTNSGVQETISSTISTSTSPGAGIVGVSATRSDSTTAVTVVTTSTGSTAELMVPSFTLTETTPSSGVFSGQITIARNPGSTATTATIDSNLNNAKVRFAYAGNTVTVTLRPTDAVITTNVSVVRNGDVLVVTVNDADRNIDPETKDTLSGLTIATQNDVITTTGTLTTTLEETGKDTGVFQKNVTIGTDIRVTSTTGTTVTQARELKITFTDRIASDVQNGVSRELVLKVGTSTGTINVTPEVIGPGTKFSILVKDADLNVNPQGVDTVASTVEYLELTTDRSNFPLTRPAAKETGPNSGEFKTTVKLAPKTTAATVAPVVTGGTTNAITRFEVLPGDLISIKYIDAKDSSGNKVTASKVVKVVSVDPEMKADKASYAVGETIVLTIADADANVDGDTIDSARITVTSPQDPVGYQVSGIETQANSGVFTFTITTTTGVSAGSITVANGGTVSLKYTDTYPADYADRVKQVVDPSKDFVLTVPIGAGTDNRSTTPSAPALKDAQGNAVSQVLAGQQVVLSTTVKNNEAGATSYAAIVEVRDSNGITVYLNWQTGTLQANGETGIGLSWTPDAPGTYTARVFVLSDLTNPRILSETVTSNINVS